jgi:hypothetical protein
LRCSGLTNPVWCTGSQTGPYDLGAGVHLAQERQAWQALLSQLCRPFCNALDHCGTFLGREQGSKTPLKPVVMLFSPGQDKNVRLSPKKQFSPTNSAIQSRIYCPPIRVTTAPQNKAAENDRCRISGPCCKKAAWRGLAHDSGLPPGAEIGSL